MSEKTIYINSLGDLEKLAQKMAKDIQYPSVFLLSGDLGTGKTTFTKMLAKILGIKSHITSPTFLIAKTYVLNNKKYFNHLDLYRLSSFAELTEIGFEEMISDGITIIEWPEKINQIRANIKILNKNIKIIKINFYHTDKENQRKIVIHE